MKGPSLPACSGVGKFNGLVERFDGLKPHPLIEFDGPSILDRNLQIGPLQANLLKASKRGRDQTTANSPTAVHLSYANILDSAVASARTNTLNRTARFNLTCPASNVRGQPSGLRKKAVFAGNLFDQPATSVHLSQAWEKGRVDFLAKTVILGIRVIGKQTGRPGAEPISSRRPDDVKTPAPQVNFHTIAFEISNTHSTLYRMYPLSHRWSNFTVYGSAVQSTSDAK